MKTSTLVRIQVLLVVLTLFVKIFRLSLAPRGYETIASSLGSLIMYAAILISIILIVKTNRINQYIKYVLRIILVLILLYIFQKILTPNTTLVNNHISNFVLVGIGAFSVGYSLNNVNLYIKELGLGSIIIGLLFLLEPINGAIMQIDNMSTGYTLAPFCIYGLLYSFYSNNKWIKILAVLPCITVALFTSRGCGLSIICFYLLGLILKDKLSLKQSFLLVGILLVVMWGILSLSLSFGGDAYHGSLIGKFLTGDIYDDNGRAYLFEIGWMLVLQHPFTGLGIDGDIAIVGRMIEDYPFIHNVIIELFLDYGIPVAILLIMLYFIPVIRSIKANKESPQSLLLLAMLCAVWIRLFFSDSYSNNIYSIMMLLGMALAFSSNQVSKIKNRI